MDKTYINNKQAKLSTNFDQNLLSGIVWNSSLFNSHEDVIKELNGKNPYTITILIENLEWKLSRKKEYVKFTRMPISTLYHELLFKNFYKEYEGNKANDMYRTWLEKYNLNWKKSGFESIDDYILFKEIEPRYKTKIMSRHKNIEKLTKSRYEYKRERYYSLPEPLNRIDWRNPYDNIFIWH